MFVFLDESGTPSLQGPQPYFVVSAVAFQAELSWERAEVAVKQLRLDWGLNAAYEVKFAKLNGQRRTQFFEKLGGLQFKHSTCVLWKDRLGGRWADRRYVYERVIREVVNGLEQHFREVDEAQVKPLRVHAVFDEYTDPEYERILKEAFGRLFAKDGLKMAPKENIKKGRSRSSSLLQVVDMVCGAHRWDTNEYRKYVVAQRLQYVELP